MQLAKPVAQFGVAVKGQWILAFRAIQRQSSNAIDNVAIKVLSVCVHGLFLAASGDPIQQCNKLIDVSLVDAAEQLIDPGFVGCGEFGERFASARCQANPLRAPITGNSHSQRQMIFDQARDKSLLNLFCYTGSVSVQAALGGASQVTSIDMSSTYIHWAEENFQLNELLDQDKYRFITADCLELLKQPGKYGVNNKFDLIFLDPPSFSNSKKMQETLDIQRDHQRLIKQAMSLLEKSGKLIFLP